MCTVTWLRQPSGYQLFCNRDEKLTRKRATPPEVRERGGVRFLAPLDGDFGGSWITTNEFGVSLCLVNGLGERREEGRSRGLVLIDLSKASTLREVREAIASYDLGAVSPFTLVGLEPDVPAILVKWDGRQCVIKNGGERFMPLVSSSFDGDGVRESRHKRWRSMADLSSKSGAFLAFHRSHEPERGPYSPCMHRADAQTVSFAWVTVDRRQAAMYYEDGPPCMAFAGESRILPLATRGLHATGPAIARPVPCAT